MGALWVWANDNIRDEATSVPLPTRRPYPDNGKLSNFRYLSWSATPTNGREPDDLQPRAQIKWLFEESELVSRDSEAFRKFTDKYTVPENLWRNMLGTAAQVKMRKEKRKEETGREQMERLNWEYYDIDWIGLYNSELSLNFSRTDQLHREESWKGRNDLSANWHLAERSNGVSTTSAAPAKKCAAISNLITFQG